MVGCWLLLVDGRPQRMLSYVVARERDNLGGVTGKAMPGEIAVDRLGRAR